MPGLKVRISLIIVTISVRSFLAQQWWKPVLSPNHTLGANNISEGVAKYCALMLMEKKMGRDNMKKYLHDESGYYIWHHRYTFLNEKPLAGSNAGYIWENKMAIFLYGLRDSLLVKTV